MGLRQRRTLLPLGLPVGAPMETIRVGAVAVLPLSFTDRLHQKRRVLAAQRIISSPREHTSLKHDACRASSSDKKRGPSDGPPRASF